MTLSCLFVLSLFLQSSVPAPAPAPSDVHDTAHLRVTTSVGPQEAGKPVTLKVDVAPKPKMHVYAPGQPDYIVISLKLDADPAFTAEPPKFPTPEKFFFEPLKEEQLVYAHPFEITDQITLAAAAAGGPVTIKGTLLYQACDDKVCYIPAKIPLEWKVGSRQ
jgi:DsbC/DsbD-like thiol-disulfide interchange protein